MGYLGRFQFSNSYLNRVSAMDCPKHLGLCYSTQAGTKKEGNKAWNDRRPATESWLLTPPTNFFSKP